MAFLLSSNAFESIKSTSIGKILSSLDYGDIKFPVFKKDYGSIQKKYNICRNAFLCFENGLVYLVHTSDEKFNDFMDLLSIADANKLHYIISKTLIDLCIICNRFKAKHKNKTHLLIYCFKFFSIEKVLVDHKDVCLKINIEKVLVDNKDKDKW